ncbi:MAG TPA: hypothetical protein VMY35_09190 [Phycisphaerae bacterium]|nr:hypothetical protein [Phycisphaerae bacterium]
MAKSLTKTLMLPNGDPQTDVGRIIAELKSLNETLYGLYGRLFGNLPAAGAPAFTRGASVAVAAADLVIPVTHAIVAKTTGGVEALTLADGDPGQVLTIVLSVHAGNGTLTPATATGFATIAFTAALQTATLLFVDAATGWILLGSGGPGGVPTVA